MILRFDARQVMSLIELSENTKERTPNLEQLIEPQFWRDDMAPARREELMNTPEVMRLGTVSLDDIDPTKIPAGLHLVGDHGVYLMANVSNEMSTVAMEGKGGHVAFAFEANPNALSADEWLESKRNSFGPDDGCDFIDATTLRENVEDSIRRGKPFRLDITPEAISIVVPQEDNDNTPGAPSP